jgi:purine-nucleoside phosphorylase
MGAYEKLVRCYDVVRKNVDFKPRIALVLGSGLGDFADRIESPEILDYSEIEAFPVSTVSGHKGRFVFGFVGSVPIVAMQGRVHYYEGYPMQDVVLPIRLMGLMGARALILTNAAGGVSHYFAPGDFMLIRDQISGFVPSPLIGPNMDKIGPRFPDMSAVYNKDLCDGIRAAAAACGIPLKEGVYIQLTGPHYETPADVRMCRILGADAVGMSTACEAIAANHMGLKVCGVSCISNLGSGMSLTPLSHNEVKETADRVGPLFIRLLTESIKRINDLI